MVAIISASWKVHISEESAKIVESHDIFCLSMGLNLKNNFLKNYNENFKF